MDRITCSQIWQVNAYGKNLYGLFLQHVPVFIEQLKI